MKIKIIDLLNKIANGEEVPKKINFCWREWNLKNDDYIGLKNNNENFIDFEGKYLFADYIGSDLLRYINDEVEIIEEEAKIPEDLDMQLGVLDSLDYKIILGMFDETQHKINQILDYLKSKED